MGLDQRILPRSDVLRVPTLDERGVMMPWCRSCDYNAIKNGTHEWEFFSDLGEFQSFLTETW